MEIPADFRRVLPRTVLIPCGEHRHCRACTHNVQLHFLSEKPWRCRLCGECPGLETAELDAMIAAFLARTLQGRRPEIPESVRSAVLERDGMVCRYCGRKVHTRSKGPGRLHFDHVIPYARGGPATVENIVVSCRTCNIDKNAHSVEEWLAKRAERFGTKAA